MRRFFAFTLAETLIVMGIIGIVSALTLPNLNASTGDKEKVVRVKKLYQNMTDALGRAVAVYGPVEEWFKNDTSNATQATRFGERLTEFMKVSKNCGLTTTGCIKSTNPTFVSSTASHSLNSNDNYKFITADGASVVLGMNIGGDPRIFIDIDGPNKGQNKIGKDVFGFYLKKDKSSIELFTSNLSAYSILTTGTGIEPTTWVINYDNMDYLKVNSSNKCNNSDITLNPSASL